LVTTVRETEVAERAKEVELVKARESAEQQAISVTVAAEAEKQAADDQAESIRIIANAESEKQRIEAQGEAESIKLRAEADAKRYNVEAIGKHAINEAANTLSAEQITMQIKFELLKQLPDIIRESVKPMEQIDDIKIIQVDGLNTAAVASDDKVNGSGNNNDNLADQLVNSALRYRGQAPIVDSLLSEIGLNGADINGLTANLPQNSKTYGKSDSDSDPD